MTWCVKKEFSPKHLILKERMDSRKAEHLFPGNYLNFYTSNFVILSGKIIIKIPVVTGIKSKQISYGIHFTAVTICTRCIGTAYRFTNHADPSWQTSPGLC